MKNSVQMPLVSILMVFVAVLLLVSQPAAAFPIPERLEFDVSYTGIPAGRAVQEVTIVGDEVHIVSTARSADWLRILFPVDDRIESVLVAGSPPLNIGVPRLYRERIREGWTRWIILVLRRFDARSEPTETGHGADRCLFSNE